MKTENTNVLVVDCLMQTDQPLELAEISTLTGVEEPRAYSIIYTMGGAVKKTKAVGHSKKLTYLLEPAAREMVLHDVNIRTKPNKLSERFPAHARRSSFKPKLEAPKTNKHPEMVMAPEVEKALTSFTAMAELSEKRRIALEKIEAILTELKA